MEKRTHAIGLDIALALAQQVLSFHMDPPDLISTKALSDRSPLEPLVECISRVYPSCVRPSAAGSPLVPEVHHIQYYHHLNPCAWPAFLVELVNWPEPP